MIFMLKGIVLALFFVHLQLGNGPFITKAFTDNVIIRLKIHLMVGLILKIS